MNDHDYLSAEIRAAKEELVRRERNHRTAGEGGLTPEIDPTFYQLQTLSPEELEAHIERLERDLDDLAAGADAWRHLTAPDS